MRPGRTQHEPASLRVGERSGEGEADPAPTPRIGAPLEDVARRRIDTRSFVADLDGNSAAGGASVDRHRAVAMVRRVGEKYLEDLTNRDLGHLRRRKIILDPQT